MWSDEWVGLPFRPMGRDAMGYDCLGLFLALQNVRRGRFIPDPALTVRNARNGDLGAFRGYWRKRELADVVEGDGLLFRMAGHLTHVAYIIDKKWMLHTSHEAGSSVIENWSSSAWQNRLEGAYRFVG